MNVTRFEILNSAIENKRIVSIRTIDKVNLQQVMPLRVFLSSKGKYYLEAISTFDKENKTYLIDKIIDVQLTSLLFEDRQVTEEFKYINVKEEVKSIDGLLENNVLNKKITSPLFKYYIECLKLESVLEVKLDRNSTYLKINKDEAESLITDDKYKKSLNENEQAIVKEFVDIIENNPGNIMYLGYPCVMNKDILYPLMFHKIGYNMDNNCIILDEKSPIFNGKFFKDSFDFSDEECDELKKSFVDVRYLNSKHDTFIDSIYKKLEERNNKIINEFGVVFIDKNNTPTMSLIKELKLIDYRTSDSKLLDAFINKNISYEQLKSKRLYNIVNINNSQKESLLRDNANIEIIQGPPGTGKTQTIINMIANYVIRGKKVLITSQNNKAVDNIIEKMSSENIDKYILRLGNRDEKVKATEKISKVIKNINEHNIITKIQVNTDSLVNEYNNATDKINETNKKIKLREDKTLYLNKLNITYKNLLNEFNGLELEVKRLNSCDKDQLNNIQMKLNKLSCVVDEYESQRYKLFWRVLSFFRFNYDKYRIKELDIQYDEINKVLNVNKDFEIIKDVKRQISNNIIQVQENILKTEIDILSKELDNLEEELLEVNIKNYQKVQVDIGRCLVDYAYHKRLLDNKESIGYLRTNISPKDGLDIASDTNVFRNLLNLYPVILCTNLSIATSVPLEELFDVVIVDEASQCNIASIIPILVRGRKLILVGDDKQLPPVITLNDKENNSLMNRYSIAEEYSFKTMSMFKFFNRILNDSNKVFLKEHYRCVPEIIDISNEFFYNNQLEILTKPLNNKNEYSGVNYLQVTGGIEKGFGGNSLKNKNEVKEIINQLQSKYSYLKNKSIGIITPYRAQKDEFNAELKKIKSKITDKEKLDFFNNITVGTIHTFQGDEKDVIYLSLVLTEGANLNSYKWLNIECNIINVAITRAKELLCIVGDLLYLSKKDGIIKEISSYVIKEGYKIESKLHQPLSIVEMLKEQAKPVIRDSNENLKSVMNRAELLFYNLLKSVISDNLINHTIGIKIRVGDVININESVGKQLFYYGLSSHFDFVVFDKEEPLKPLLVIELDGETHRRDYTQIQRDEKKDLLCKKNGLRLLRISTKEKLNADILWDKIQEC